MSRINISIIAPDGDVVRYGEAGNASAGVPWIWDVLSRDAGLGRYPTLKEQHDACLRKFNDPATPRATRIVIGFTFDNLFVRTRDIPELARELRAFYGAHGFAPDWQGIKRFVTATLLEVADLIEEAAALPGVRGVCFQQTSVTTDPWRVAVDDDESRPFNFDRDTKTAWGGEPWELFNVLGAAGS